MTGEKEKLRISVLVLFGLAIAVLLSISVLCIYRLHRSHIRHAVQRRIAGIEKLFQWEQDENAEELKGLIDLISQDRNLQEAWLGADRESLLKYTMPLLKDVLSTHRVTHFYFHGPDKVCFLRVHTPLLHGDYIDRFTLERAELTGKAVHGVELGPLGTFALRVAKPWYIDDKLVGYIELGQDITRITAELRDVIGADILFIVHKSHLDRDGWTEGLKITGRSGEWDEFPGFVIIDRTMQELPEQLNRYLERLATYATKEHLSSILRMSLEGRFYLGGFSPLSDARGKNIGNIVVIEDVTLSHTALGRLLIILIAACVVIGVVLFGLFYLYLGRVQRRIRKTHNDLINEAEAHREAEKDAEQKRFLTDVMNSLSNPFYVVAVEDFKLVLANAATFDAARNPRAKTCYALMHDRELPCSTQGHPCPVEEIKKTHKPVTLEDTFPDKDGNLIDVRVYGSPVFDRQGQLQQVVEHVVEVTEQKRLQQDLYRTRERLRYLLRYTPAVIYSCEPSGDYAVTFVGGNIAENFGYTSEEFMSTPGFWADHIHPHDRDRVFQEISCIAQKGRIIYEYRFLHKDGNYRWVLDEVNAVYDADGACTELVGYIIDITARKQAEDELKRAKEYSELIISSSVDGILTFDRECRYTLWNKGMEAISGMKKEEVVGKCAFDLFPFLKEVGEDRVFFQTLEGNVVTIKNRPYRIKETGQEGFFDGLYSPLRDKTDAVIGGLAIIREVTERVRAEQQLTESERRFRVMFEQAAVGVAQIVSQTGQFVRINQRYCDIVGYAREEMENLTFQEITHPDDLPEDLDNMKLLLDGKIREFTMQKRYLRKNGSIVWVNLSVSPMWSVGEQPDYHIAVVQDISARKQAEEMLRQSEERYRSLVENIDLGITLVDLDHNIIMTNSAIGKMYNRPAATFIGEKCYSRYKDQQQACDFCPGVKAVKTGRAEVAETNVVREDGSEFVARIYGFPVFDEAGKATSFIEVQEDVTEQKKAEEDLLLLSCAISKTLNGIVITRHEPTLGNPIIYLNPAFERMTGYSLEEAMGKDCRFLQGRDQDQPGLDEIRTALREVRGCKATVRNYRKDGSAFWNELSISPVYDKTDKATHFVGVMNDITERKEAEDVLRSIVEGSAGATGQEFFRILVKSLAGSLGFRYAFVGEVPDPVKNRVRTIAVWANGEYADNFEYDLEGAPCEKIVGQKTRCYADDVQEQFPGDRLLVELGVKSYCGAPLFDSSGGALGLLVIMDNKKMQKEALAQSMLTIFASRAASELERRKSEQQLIEAKEKYESLVRNVPDAIYSALPDKTGTSIFMSGKWKDWTGYSPEDFEKDPETWSKSIHPEDRDTAVQAYMRAGEEKTDFLSEYRVVHKDTHQVHYLRDHGTPIKDQAGEVIRFDGVVTDITDRKRAEDALRESRETLSMALAISNAGVSDWNVKTGKIVVDETLIKGLGYSKEEFPDTVQGLRRLYHPDEREKLISAIDRHIRLKDTPFTSERRLLAKNGEWRWIYSRGMVVSRDKEGNPERVLGTAVDITGRRRVEEQARNLAKFPAENPDPVMRITRDGVLLYANAASEPFLSDWGCEVGQNVPGEQSRVVSEVFASGTAKRIEMEHADRIFAFMFTPISEADYVNLYGRDITQRRRAEEDLARYRKHLEELVDARTSQLTQEIERRIRLEQQILTVSEDERRTIGQELHDSIGQRLTGIAFMTKVLEGKLAARSLPEAGDVAKMAVLVNRTTDQARDLAKGLHPMDLSRATLVSSLPELAAGTERLYGVNCIFTCQQPVETATPEVGTHLYRIVQEAIVNAVKHGEARNIYLELTRRGTEGLLIVRNDGMDFPEDIDVRGQGIGLQIMDHRADIIGGSLDIRRAPEGGTILTCTFPIKGDDTTEV